MKKRLAPLAVAAVAAVAATIPASAGAAVSVGHSGWAWGNPLPQGNTLRTIDFAGGRGFAAGEFGTLLRTDDGGATWTGVPTGITADLSRVRVVGQNTVIIAGGCTARRSDDGGQTFRRMPFTNSELRCSAGVQSFSFPASQTGYLLLSDGTVLATDDGGQTFARRTAVPGTSATGATSVAQPSDILFTSATTGFAITRGNGGKLYRTTDGGASWTLQTTTPSGLNALWFESPGQGYVVGDQNTLLATADGGENWTAKPLGGSTPSNLSSIRCTGSACVLATTAGDRLLRTSDGGDTAFDVSPSTQKIFAAAFASPTQVVGVGEAGATVLSGDGGQNFTAVGSRLLSVTGGLVATSSTVAWATGPNGALARTSDGGQSWRPGGVPTSEAVSDVSFIDGQSGYALDSAGALFKTGNGGTSWQLLDTGSSAISRAVVAIGAGRVLLVGPVGVRRSSDGGTTFSRVSARPLRTTSLRHVDAAGRAVFAYGTRKAFFSPNAGGRWVKLRLPARRAFRRLDFVSSRTGFALESDGRLWFTKNRGRHWAQLVGAGTLEAFDMNFSDSKHGYLLVSSFGGRRGGFLLRTSDGGHSFRPQLVSRDALGAGGLASAGGTDYARDSQGHLFFTRTGGDQGTTSSLRLKTKKRKLRKAATIKVSGRLAPASGGEQIVVSARSTRGGWVHKVVQASASGTFTTVWKVRRSTIFVAQWLGDSDRNGAGSKVLGVSLKKR